MSTQTAIAAADAASLLERVVVQGDLAKLSSTERVDYYRRVCDSLGLNPLTRPFQYIVLNGKLTLYASRDCTDQLRRIHRVSVTIIARERIDDVYVVTARAVAPDGRSDESIGAVSIGGLKGDALANALMKADTKAKRRATLSLIGLGWLDETETETIPGARQVAVADTGEIVEQAAQAQIVEPVGLQHHEPKQSSAATAPLSDEMPEGTPAQQREWFQRRLETLVIERRWTRDQLDAKAKSVAIEIKRRGVNNDDRLDAYEWFTGVRSGKDMTQEQLYLLEVNAHRVDDLRRCAVALREEKAQLGQMNVM